MALKSVITFGLSDDYISLHQTLHIVSPFKKMLKNATLPDKIFHFGQNLV
jgi:hypothetical protein